VITIPNKKKITKDERVKKVFAETTMEMIREYGIESVTVRKVAELASYSLGTLYGHFKNLDELLWYTKRFFVDEISQYFDSDSAKRENDTFKSLLKTYVDYFVENRNVFKFFFFTSLDKSEKGEFNLSQITNVDKRTKEIFLQYMKESACTPVQLEIKLKSMLYSIHGMLMIYVTDNEELTKEALYRDFSNIMDSLFE